MAKVTTVDFDAAVKPQNSSIYIGQKEGAERGERRVGGEWRMEKKISAEVFYFSVKNINLTFCVNRAMTFALTAALTACASCSP